MKKKKKSVGDSGARWPRRARARNKLERLIETSAYEL